MPITPASKTPDGKAANVDRGIRKLLADGDKPVLRALQAAGDGLDAAAKNLHGDTPARAELLMAACAGVITAMAALLHTREAPQPPGYRGGRPTARDLTSAYEAAYQQTLRQGQQTQQ